jgi:hypothetical protein
LTLGQNALFIRLVVAAVYAKVGRAGDARKILEEAEKTGTPGSSVAIFIAAVHDAWARRIELSNGSKGRFKITPDL